MSPAQGSNAGHGGQYPDSLCRLYPNPLAPFSTLNALSPYITPRKREATMYDAVILIMGLAMFAAFLAYAAACEKM